VVADYVQYDADLDEITVAGRVGTDQIPEGSTGISTTTDISRATSFLTLLGTDTAAASAHATAVTGPASLPPLMHSNMLPNDGGIGILPVGVHYDVVWDALVGEEKCVIDSESWKNKDTDGVIGHAAHSLPSANRGWIMLSCVFNDGVIPGTVDGVPIGPRTPDCSASNNKIKDWIDQSNPFDKTIYSGPVGSDHGDWIVGDEGSRSASFQELENLGITNPTDTFYIPVFDRIYLGYHMEEVFEEPGNLFTHNDFWYHIVGFIGVHVNPPGTSTTCSSGDISVTFDTVVYYTTQPDFTEEWGWEEGDTCEILELTITLWE
jgi:hypothetical protein